MAVLRIFIVRHGETEENRLGIMQGQLDTPLNAAGIEQAGLTAGILENVKFKMGYSSDLSRAVQTAEIILSKHPGVQCEKHEELRERVSGFFGSRPYASRMLSYHSFQRRNIGHVLNPGDSLVE